MNERTYWATRLKPTWHRPPRRWIAWHVEDIYNGGLPDVDACFEGVTAKLEVKYRPDRPSDTQVCCTFSANKDGSKTIVKTTQARFLEEWCKAGGLAYVFICMGNVWWLVPWLMVINTGMSEDELDTACELRGDVGSESRVPPYLIDHYGYH